MRSNLLVSLVKTGENGAVGRGAWMLTAWAGLVVEDLGGTSASTSKTEGAGENAGGV